MHKINRQKRAVSSKPQATLQARKLRPGAKCRKQLQLCRNDRLDRDLLQHATKKGARICTRTEPPNKETTPTRIERSPRGGWPPGKIQKSRKRRSRSPSS